MENQIVQAEMLETEVKSFACSLPCFAKYICSNILTDSILSASNIDTAFSYLKEELGLIEKTEKPEINLNYNPNNLEDYKENLVINALQKVEGVNALSENQIIEFSPNITIIYGINGSGKSGYVRLLKNVFYSKHEETIQQNIYKNDVHTPVNAEFNFTSEGSNIYLKYPADSENRIFNQFAVFDGKIALKHLENRNDFEFRPAGLTLFSEFNIALEKLQKKLNLEIALKPVNNSFPEIFEGESKIKTLVNTLSSDSNFNDLKAHTPFTEKDKTNKQKIDKEYDDFKIVLSQKENFLKTLREMKIQLVARKKNLEIINQYFNQNYLDSICNSIFSCKTKQQTAISEGVENFKTDKLKNVGTPEWKQFIEAAEKFALIQKEGNQSYPEIGDNCLLCQQPIIDKEPSNLIKSYWEYIKSVAEQEAKTAQENLDKTKKGFEDLNLNQFIETDILTVWLKENHIETLESLKKILTNQEVLKANVISNITSKNTNKQAAIQLDLTKIDDIETAIDTQITVFEKDEQSQMLTELLKNKTYLAHKEKLGQRLSDIEKLHQNMIWVSRANKFDKQYWKGNSTRNEKRLSQKYFNEQYIKTFNEECDNLNGNFGIDVDAKSSDGQSNRQLFLKGKAPSVILSEGEQKVIAIADFMAESKLSTINKGIIFDDPVNSLDEERKSNIAERLVKEAVNKQVIIFTHDLVFLNALYNYSRDLKQVLCSHWVERIDEESGVITLNNSPSLEADYKKSGEAQFYRDEAKQQQGRERERSIKHGFTALRTNYEALTIFAIFNGAVERFNERVSIDRLKGMILDKKIIDEVIESYDLCCRYMEGHLHSNKYGAKKPTFEGLVEEINRFDDLNTKIKALKKINLNK